MRNIMPPLLRCLRCCKDLGGEHTPPLLRCRSSCTLRCGWCRWCLRPCPCPWRGAWLGARRCRGWPPSRPPTPAHRGAAAVAGGRGLESRQAGVAVFVQKAERHKAMRGLAGGRCTQGKASDQRQCCRPQHGHYTTAPPSLPPLTSPALRATFWPAPSPVPRPVVPVVAPVVVAPRPPEEGEAIGSGGRRSWLGRWRRRPRAVQRLLRAHARPWTALTACPEASWALQQALCTHLCQWWSDGAPPPWSSWTPWWCSWRRGRCPSAGCGSDSEKTGNNMTRTA